MVLQSTPGHIPQENSNLKRYMHPSVHSCTIYNSQDMEATQVSINRGLDKEDVIIVYTVEYCYSVRRENEISPIAVTLVYLGVIILRELKLTGRHKYHMI